MIFIILLFALIVAILAATVTALLNRFHNYKNEVNNKFIQLSVDISNLQMKAEEKNAEMVEVLSMLESNTKNVEVVRDALNVLSDNYSEHLTKQCPTDDNYVPEENKPTKGWPLDVKKKCQDYILQHKHMMTYVDMSSILNVPSSTLKRWGAELNVNAL